MSECYNCAECQASLYGQKYILKEENMYCIECYEALFSTTCEVCQLLISCTSKVNHGDRNFPVLVPLTLLRCKIWKNKVSLLPTELDHWACWMAVWCFCPALLSMVIKLIQLQFCLSTFTVHFGLPEMLTEPRICGSAGSVLQRPPLAQRMLLVPQMQPFSGGPAICHQGRHVDVRRVLQQRVLRQVPRLHEDHHAR